MLVRGKDGSLTLKRVVLDDAGAHAAAPPRDDDPVWLAIPDFILWGGDALLDGVVCTSTTTSPMRVRDAWRAVIAREERCDGPGKNVVVEALGP